jgi:GNAT superfamily N-acetyltransferase
LLTAGSRAVSYQRSTFSLFSAELEPGEDYATSMRNLATRLLEGRDVAPISASLSEVGWKNKPRSQYERYVSEQQEGLRTVFVAFVAGDFAGYVTINWSPTYPPFRAGKIPEIQDFNVLPRFRRQGVGTRLMDEAERKISVRSGAVGIGVGMLPDYGAAQRLYILRGYVPDGKGLTYEGCIVEQGDEITVNDGLVLYLTKTLPSDRRRGV